MIRLGFSRVKHFGERTKAKVTSCFAASGSERAIGKPCPSPKTIARFCEAKRSGEIHCLGGNGLLHRPFFRTHEGAINEGLLKPEQPDVFTTIYQDLQGFIKRAIFLPLKKIASGDFSALEISMARLVRRQLRCACTSVLVFVYIFPAASRRQHEKYPVKHLHQIGTGTPRRFLLILRQYRKQTVALLDCQVHEQDILSTNKHCNF